MAEEEVLALIKASSGTGNGNGSDESRIDQWGFQETSHLIAIKSQLDESGIFFEKDQQWSLVSARMAEIGFCKSAGQCKNHWKGLVSQYKTFSSMENPSTSSFPFLNQLHAAMIRRQNQMQDMRMKAKIEVSDENDDTESVKIERPKAIARVPSNSKKRKAQQQEQQQQQSHKGKTNGFNSIQEVLLEFLREQRESENAWRKMIEERERSRKRREEEWMKRMESIEKERLRMECIWREKEEERRSKEEVLYQKRDSLLTTLLTQLIQQDHL
eukprot:TRINITY_DN36094_c0_g1_i1.p1 TRINITY_DN36094_c0_g1~~TRINITY_DN36094_c0_g1_i1.p1  ORF type:complete len:271 (+),score=78.77 TRINITY_DN36094_c0_g1_i1:146-958(+)